MPRAPSTSGIRRRQILVLAVSLPAVAHAGYNIWTSEYTLSREQIQAGIEPRFPVRMRYAEIFELRLSHPRVTLLPRANRLVVTTDTLVRNPLLLPTPLSGVLAISSGLRFDAAARAVRLYQPTTERLELQGLSADDARNLQALGAFVAQQVLRDCPLHTFTPEQLRLGNRPVEIGEITVVEDGLKVEVR
ncbi:DUF1439 domain-containing protein [Xylophilus sp. ASV27]|uniref:DUF1439 domain-containing protein n=1 Tax=Xylophilus sp. ASV27 TaxID=2795129 RepID=UPI0018EBDBF6|nr:DUF1439 domain-containing protein [Xylophilus sp. ASV27]